MLESKLSKEVGKYLLALMKTGECWYANIVGSGFQKGGLPDYVVLYKGTMIGVELKKPVDSYGATDRQLRELKRITNAGGIGVTVDSLDQLKEIIKSLDN